MSYTPTEWKTGDVITAEKLNNMESGIFGSAKVLFVELNTETGAIDKTWNEINSAIASGVLCLIAMPEGNDGHSTNVLTGSLRINNQYNVYVNFETVETATMLLTAESPDDYPAIDNK